MCNAGHVTLSPRRRTPPREKRNAMQCDKCHRDLEEDAPVYLVYRSCRDPKFVSAVTTKLFCESCEPYDHHPVAGEDFFHLPGETEQDAIRRHSRNRPCINSRFRASPCENCGRMITAPESLLRKHWVCSQRCRKVIHRRREREAREKQREGMVCDVCGTAFAPARLDARTCSSACRQKAYRRRKSA